MSEDQLGIGTRLLFTGLLMVAVGIALLVTELLGGHPLNSRFAVTVGIGGLVIAGIGWLIERGAPDR